ncbi:MAG TPA: ATP-binding protein [Saprospiraceae bacterium]|nr:ATP-binding protein [Saprospiraceae bacterium]
MKLVGREHQKRQIARYLNEDRAHFIAIYGRRRVGKTFLVKQYFKNNFTFYCTGLLNGKKNQQLTNFLTSIKNQLDYFIDVPSISNWYEAFNELIKALSNVKLEGKKVIFLDELPWMDNPGSDFLLGLEFFWNSWASTQKDIFFIVCGSSTSWIVNKLFNNKGGLYNRITGKLSVEPFTLHECYLFFNAKEFKYTQEQCIEAYMVFGGIPYYLDQFDKSLSPTQNIDELCFGKNAFLALEYQMLFKSLFRKYQNYINVVEAIGSKNKGLTREEIAKATNLSDGGSLTRILKELELSSFIKKYNPIAKKTKGSLFQLRDPFCLFYSNLNSQLHEENFWIKHYNSPKYNNWAGYAFEVICYNHIPQIKKALGISGINSNNYSWQNQDAQIDLVIDRADKVVNVFEIKFSRGPFVITKKYDLDLRQKVEQFRLNTPGQKAIWPIFIAPYGLGSSPYNYFFLKELTMEIFFDALDDL